MYLDLNSKNKYMCFTPAMLKWMESLTNIYTIGMIKVKCVNKY